MTLGLRLMAVSLYSIGSALAALVIGAAISLPLPPDRRLSVWALAALLLTGAAGLLQPWAVPVVQQRITTALPEHLARSSSTARPAGVPVSQASHRPPPLPRPAGVPALTEAEQLVVTAVAHGCSTREICQAVSITPAGVRIRLHRAAAKIADPPARAHLVHRALTYGEIPWSPGPAPSRPEPLPVDQWTVLHCVAAGMSQRRIAAETGWPVLRVRFLASQLQRALGARTLPHLVYLAWCTGLLGHTPTDCRKR